MEIGVDILLPTPYNHPIKTAKGATMNTKVFVYFNLHKRVFSVKALTGPNKGRVIGHTASLAIASPTFKVSEAGRQRVLAEKRKNVHAGVVGYITDGFTETLTSITYNPYKYSSFVEKATHEPIHAAEYARMVVVNGYPEITVKKVVDR